MFSSDYGHCLGGSTKKLRGSASFTGYFFRRRADGPVDPPKRPLLCGEGPALPYAVTEPEAFRPVQRTGERSIRRPPERFVPTHPNPSTTGPRS